MITDFGVLISGLLARFWGESHVMFGLTGAVGLLLAGLSWWLASWVAANFNRQFSMHWQHHLYCGIAAAITLVCTILFVTCRYTEPVAEGLVDVWTRNVLEDGSWREALFRQTYDAVYALRDAAGKQLEDFTGHPRPGTGQKTTIPTNQEASKQTAAQAYAKGALEHFRAQHGFLSTVLWPHAEAAREAIAKDMARVFDSGTQSYDPKDAIELASGKIRQELKIKASRIVVLSRVVLVCLFLVVQGLTLGLLIRAALADIPERKTAPRYIGD